MCFLQGYFRASVAFLAAAVLLCRAVPQVQLVLQSLRRPCSHSPWPGAACSAFSTSKAERGPTPQRYTADTHIHIQTHTHSNRGLFSFSARAKHEARRLSHRFSLLCLAFSYFSCSSFFVLLLPLYTISVTFSYTYRGPVPFSVVIYFTNELIVLDYTSDISHFTA